MDAQDEPHPVAHPLPRSARKAILDACATLDGLALKIVDAPARGRQWAVLTVFVAFLAYGIVMGVLRSISVDKAAGSVEVWVPAAAGGLVLLILGWPRRRPEPPEDAAARAEARAALQAHGLEYVPESRSLAETSQIVWAHNWQRFDPDEPGSFQR